MSKSVKFQLVLTVEIDPQGVPTEELKHNVHKIIQNAMNNGTLTGETPATVEHYSYSVTDISPGCRYRCYSKK